MTSPGRSRWEGWGVAWRLGFRLGWGADAHSQILEKLNSEPHSRLSRPRLPNFIMLHSILMVTLQKCVPQFAMSQTFCTVILYFLHGKLLDVIFSKTEDLLRDLKKGTCSLPDEPYTERKGCWLNILMEKSLRQLTEQWVNSNSAFCESSHTFLRQDVKLTSLFFRCGSGTVFLIFPRLILDSKHHVK